MLALGLGLVVALGACEKGEDGDGKTEEESRNLERLYGRWTDDGCDYYHYGEGSKDGVDYRDGENGIEIMSGARVLPYVPKERVICEFKRNGEFEFYEEDLQDDGTRKRRERIEDPFGMYYYRSRGVFHIEGDILYFRMCDIELRDGNGRLIATSDIAVDLWEKRIRFEGDQLVQEWVLSPIEEERYRQSWEKAHRQLLANCKPSEKAQYEKWLADKDEEDEEERKRDAERLARDQAQFEKDQAAGRKWFQKWKCVED